MLSWKENKAELGWRRYSHFPAVWTSKRAWVCHSGFQTTHESWNRASLTSLHISLSGAAKPKPKQKARSLDLTSGFEIGMVMVRKGSQIRWHSVTCYNYNRNYKAKTQCGSWVKKANSGQTRAQSGQGPGHAIAAMVYVKSWAEGKRMKFNLVLSTATCCPNKPYGLWWALKASTRPSWLVPLKPVSLVYPWNLWRTSKWKILTRFPSCI